MNTRAYRFKESPFWIFSFWKSLSWVRGHVALFQTLFLCNLSSEKEPAAQSIWSRTPRSFHHIPQSLPVNTPKLLPGCIQTRRPPVPNGFQSPCVPFPCLQIRQIAYSAVLRKGKGFWMNRNGMTTYLSFPFCRFPCHLQPFMKLVSELVRFLMTSFPILKSCVGVRYYSTGGPFCVTRRKSPGILRLSFHTGEWCWAFRNIFLISWPWKRGCWMTASCQNDTCTSTPTTALFSPHTHHAHHHVSHLSPALLVRQV